VVYGALDPKAGACGSVVTVIPNPRLNHVPDVEGGVLEAEAVALLQSFFKSRR
jgi:tRNA(adenine34) deaminase